MRRVVIIGAGLAGLSAALRLAERGIGSELISPQPSERAQSVLAEGGINAALDLMGEGDSPAEHFADTMRGGCFLADPNAVAGLTAAAPELVRRLRALGTPFQTEEGRMIQRAFGGQKKKRTAYAKSSTGKVLMTAMIDAVRRYEALGLVCRWPRHTLAGLRIKDGCCRGATVRDGYTGDVYLLRGPVILACGGLNGLFPGRTTGTTANTGDAAALAFSLGAEMGNLEMLQYHPTTVLIPGKRLLVSEAARGEGGRLYIVRGGAPWYFMEERAELGNLAPRDVIAREMNAVCARPDCGGQVYLELTGLSGNVWRRRLPDLREELRRYLNLDPAKQPVPVSPGIHFFMGGVLADEKHRTSIPGLYAAGECACQYHGANRLGGNSLLGAIYGGEVAAQSAAEQAAREAAAPPERLERAAEAAARPEFSEKLGAALFSGLGIARDARTLAAALEALKALQAAAVNDTERRRAALGEAMLRCALARRESRGAHTRTDYPARDDAQFQKTTVAALRNGELEIIFRPIPERRERDAAP